jgi:hypothetical protein
MYSRSNESLKAGGQEVLCWRCEEIVHHEAHECPYCHAEMKKHLLQPVSSQEKITQIPFQKDLPLERVSNTPHPLLETLRLIFSLIFLLGGSTLFFLAIMIALFSKDGALVISWKTESWAAFFGLGIALLSFGVLCLQKPTSSEEF